MTRQSRRKIIKGLAITLPAVWVTPMVESVILPAHADISGDAGCGPLGSPGPFVLGCDGSDEGGLLGRRLEFTIVDLDGCPFLNIASTSPTGNPGGSVPLAVEFTRQGTTSFTYSIRAWDASQLVAQNNITLCPQTGQGLQSQVSALDSFTAYNAVLYQVNVQISTANGSQFGEIRLEVLNFVPQV